MNKRKTLERKQFLNDVDVPLSKTNVKVVKGAPNVGGHVIAKVPKSILKPTPQPQPQPKLAATSSNKYKRPELHSTLAVSKNIEKIKQTQAPSVTSIGQLTPKSKKFVHTQITKKLNFQHDEHLYRGLGPVNVNDSVLIPDGRPTRRYSFKGKKDPEPDLAEFLRPIPRCDFQFQPYIPPEPVAKAKDGLNSYESIVNALEQINGRKL